MKNQQYIEEGEHPFREGQTNSQQSNKPNPVPQSYGESIVNPPHMPRSSQNDGPSLGASPNNETKTGPTRPNPS